MAEASRDVAADLLASAAALLAADGAAGLSVRRVAEAAGCSTMAIYSRFGGKAGMLDALAREGFERLADAIDAAQSESAGDPRDELGSMCAAMRDVALADPLRYRLMYGPLIEPSAETREAARRSLASLREAVGRVAESGAIETGDAGEAATRVFAICHGLIAAELAGIIGHDGAGDGAARLERALDAALGGLSGA